MPHPSSSDQPNLHSVTKQQLVDADKLPGQPTTDEALDLSNNSLATKEKTSSEERHLSDFTVNRIISEPLLRHSNVGNKGSAFRPVARSNAFDHGSDEASDVTIEGNGELVWKI